MTLLYTLEIVKKIRLYVVLKTKHYIYFSLTRVGPLQDVQIWRADVFVLKWI